MVRCRRQKMCPSLADRKASSRPSVQGGVGIVFAAPMRCFAHAPLFGYCATPPAELFPVQTHYTNFHSCGCEPPALGIGLYYLSFVVDLVLDANANCILCVATNPMSGRGCFTHDLIFVVRLLICCCRQHRLSALGIES